MVYKINNYYTRLYNKPCLYSKQRLLFAIFNTSKLNFHSRLMQYCSLWQQSIFLVNPSPTPGLGRSLGDQKAKSNWTDVSLLHRTMFSQQQHTSRWMFLCHRYVDYFLDKVQVHSYLQVNGNLCWKRNFTDSQATSYKYRLNFINLRSCKIRR